MSSLFLQLTGIFYLVSVFFVARIFKLKFKKFKTILIFIIGILYTEIILLSIFKYLEPKYFLPLILFHMYLIVKNKSYINPSINFNFLNLNISLIYGLCTYLLSLSSYNQDDYLSIYLPRTLLWIKEKTVFINYDLSPIYQHILNYPITGHIDIFLFKFFNFPYFINVIIFLFVINEIYLSFIKNLDLNENDTVLFKIFIFFCPIIFFSFLNFLHEVLFTYFVINSLLTLLNCYRQKSFDDYSLVIIYAIFAVGTRISGIYLLITIFLFSLSKFKEFNFIKYVFRAKYFLSLTGLFITVNMINYIWNLLNSVETFKVEYITRHLPIGQGGGLSVIDLFINIKNSILLVSINSLIADLPFIFFLDKDFINYTSITNLNIIKLSNTLTKYNIFENAHHARTIGPYIFFSILLLTLKFKFKNKNVNNALFISVLYFLLISIRPYNDSNIRYTFPILLFYFGVLYFSTNMKFLKNLKIKTLLIILLNITIIQGMTLSTRLFETPIPYLELENETKLSETRGFHFHGERRNIYDSTLKLINTSNLNIIFSMDSKYPLGLIENFNNIKFITFDNLPLCIDRLFFNSLSFNFNSNSNLLIVDKKINICDNNDIIYIENDNFKEKFNPNYIYILDLSEK